LTKFNALTITPPLRHKSYADASDMRGSIDKYKFTKWHHSVHS